MFGFPSPTKLLVLVAIISAIWFGLRLLSQIERGRREAERREKERGRGQPKAPRQVADMVKCSVCGTFTAPGSKPCGKAGCPF
jgi:hypothetical protein